MKKNTKKKVSEIVTDKIIKQLEDGVVPWSKPWTNLYQKNAVSDNKYTGFNQVLLQIEASLKGYSSNYWVTYKQARKLGGHVRKGEKSIPITFYKNLTIKEENEDGEEEEKNIKIMRYYRVFNIEQCKKIEIEEEKIEENQDAEEIINNYITKESVSLKIGGNKASYNLNQDLIKIPSKSQFKTSNSMYPIIFHEMTHSTGHPDRLGRMDKNIHTKFGSCDYSKEELVAELGACILCSFSSIKPNIKRSASYIKNWLKKLKDNRNLLISAGSKADKAVNYINREK